jgi:hypothetical protein
MGGQMDTVTSVAISADGRRGLAGGEGDDGTLMLWNLCPSPWLFRSAIALTVAFVIFCVWMKLRARQRAGRSFQRPVSP